MGGSRTFIRPCLYISPLLTDADRDGVGSKPWVDGRDSAAYDFYQGESIVTCHPSKSTLTHQLARGTWEPTWGPGNERGMTVKNVKMWQEGKCTK
jgi:hypothetical protein